MPEGHGQFELIICQNVHLVGGDFFWRSPVGHDPREASWSAAVPSAAFDLVSGLEHFTALESGRRNSRTPRRFARVVTGTKNRTHLVSGCFGPPEPSLLAACHGCRRRREETLILELNGRSEPIRASSRRLRQFLESGLDWLFSRHSHLHQTIPPHRPAPGVLAFGAGPILGLP